MADNRILVISMTHCVIKMARKNLLFDKINEINNTIPSAGLGLSMAQKLLKVMYGTITVKSLKGKGTKVETVQPHRFAKKEDIITEATFTAKIEESEQKNN